MIRTVIALCFWLLAVFVAVLFFALPSLRPGHPNCIAALIGIACLLAGPWFQGRRCGWLPLYFIYGCVGGLMFVPLFLPDPWGGVGKTKSDDWVFTIASIVGVVIAGVACRVTAGASYHREHMYRGAFGRCRQCGYLLLGLPEPRCPECGTPFDPTQAWNPGEEQGRVEAAEEKRPVE